MERTILSGLIGALAAGASVCGGAAASVTADADAFINWSTLTLSHNGSPEAIPRMFRTSRNTAIAGWNGQETSITDPWYAPVTSPMGGGVATAIGSATKFGLHATTHLSAPNFKPYAAEAYAVSERWIPVYGRAGDRLRFEFDYWLKLNLETDARGESAGGNAHIFVGALEPDDYWWFPSVTLPEAGSSRWLLAAAEVAEADPFVEDGADFAFSQSGKAFFDFKFATTGMLYFGFVAEASGEISATVPAPGAWALVLLGGGLALCRRRRGERQE